MTSRFSVRDLTSVQLLGTEPDLPPGWHSRLHELPDRFEYSLELRVVRLFHLGQPGGQFLVAGEQPAEPNERSHDLDIRLKMASYLQQRAKKVRGR